MAQIYLVCGMICSGKSYYAQRLQKEKNAVILSTDEITLALPYEAFRDCFEQVSDSINSYLMNKSLEILAAGVDVILDWGFWTRKNRDEIRAFYADRGIACTLYYIDADSDTLAANVTARNRAVDDGTTAAYYVDDGLAEKCRNIFEVPDEEEIDVRIENRRC